MSFTINRLKEIIIDEINSYLGNNTINCDVIPVNDNVMIQEQKQELDINKLPFKDSVNKSGGKMYSVGGAVRDSFLGKDSKDLDLLITGLSLDDLERILSPFGKVVPQEVGGKVAMLLLKMPDSEDIDIAIPRTEIKKGDGYKGFDIKPDHTLPIEDDLLRRDFTINAIAKDADGNIVDPYNGQGDLKNKIIRMVSSKSFKEDPLRMLRAVQFASRFGFSIEPKTFKAIVENADSISEITPERVMLEFGKIVTKGNMKVGMQLLAVTGLFKSIFGEDFKGDLTNMYSAEDMADFILVMLKDNFENPQEVFKTRLKGDVFNTKKIGATNIGITQNSLDKARNRMTVNRMNKISPASINSKLLPKEIKETVQEMRDGKFPISFKELEISGDDLLEAGFSGPKMGQAFTKILQAIYREEINNFKEDILEYAENIR